MGEACLKDRRRHHVRKALQFQSNIQQCKQDKEKWLTTGPAPVGTQTITTPDSCKSLPLRPLRRELLDKPFGGK